MPTSAQSILAFQGQTKNVTLVHETTFSNYTVSLLIGLRNAEEELSLVKEVALAIDGNGDAYGSLTVDMAPDTYEMQLLLVEDGTNEEEIVQAPNLIVKARIGGWPESP
jgi:hypothetical protein